MTLFNHYQDQIVAFVLDSPGRIIDAVYVMIDVPAWKPSYKMVFQAALAGLVEVGSIEIREGRVYPAN